MALHHQQCDTKHSWHPLIMNSEQKQVEKQSVGNVKYLNDAQQDLINFQFLNRKEFFIDFGNADGTLMLRCHMSLILSDRLMTVNNGTKSISIFKRSISNSSCSASDWCSAIRLTYDKFDVWMSVTLCGMIRGVLSQMF